MILTERGTELHSPGFIPDPKGVSVCEYKTHEQDPSHDTSSRCRGLNGRRLGQLPLTSGKDNSHVLGDFGRRARRRKRDNKKAHLVQYFLEVVEIMCCQKKKKKHLDMLCKHGGM